MSAGRLRLRGDDLPQSSSGGLLKRPPMGSGSRVTPWDSRRGRSLDCAQGTTSAGHLTRRRAGGGRDASWRMRVAAVTCCEADDRVVHSAALRTPCRPERCVVTTARPSAERLQSIPARPRMRWGCTTRDCEGTHRECCVCMWSPIDRPRGHDWVCVYRRTDNRGGSTNTVCE